MAKYHPLSETESKAPAELAVCIVFLVLTYLAVSARCWVRIHMIHSFGWDDALMVVALVFFSVYCLAIIVIAYEYGGGTHVAVIGTAMHWILVSETFYVLTAMMLKLSLGVFFLRIITKPWQRCMVYVVMILTTLTCIFFFFFLVLMCGNPRDFLVRYVADKCTSRDVQLVLAYLSAATGTFADWMYAILPVQIVAKASMKRRTKVSVLLILSLGTVGSVCSTVRLKYIGGLVSPTEFLWNAAMIAIWSGIECGAGITAGSLATLRPLFKRWFATFRTMTQSSPTTRRQQPRSASKSPSGQASDRPEANSRPTLSWPSSMRSYEKIGSNNLQTSSKGSRQGIRQEEVEMRDLPRDPSRTREPPSTSARGEGGNGLVTIIETLDHDHERESYLEWPLRDQHAARTTTRSRSHRVDLESGQPPLARH